MLREITLIRHLHCVTAVVNLQTTPRWEGCPTSRRLCQSTCAPSADPPSRSGVCVALVAVGGSMCTEWRRSDFKSDRLLRLFLIAYSFFFLCFFFLSFVFFKCQCLESVIRKIAAIMWDHPPLSSEPSAVVRPVRSSCSLWRITTDNTQQTSPVRQPVKLPTMYWEE